MSRDRYTLTEVLDHHGVAVMGRPLASALPHMLPYYTDQLDMSESLALDAAIADLARACGIISVCLGCATVTAISTAGHDDVSLETARRATRDAIDWDRVECDTFPECAHATTVMF